VVLSEGNSDGEGIGRTETRSLAIAKPMNHTKIDKARTAAINQAASLIVIALAPLAAVIGIAVMSVPSADAGVGLTHCARKSDSVQFKACVSTDFPSTTSIHD